MTDYYKVLEFFTPSGYLLNDNVKNDYRSNMGKMKWLTKQTEIAVQECELDKKDKDPKILCNVIPKSQLTKLDPDHFGLVVYHIKLGNKNFDFFNYERTMKPSIDILTSNGYWSDDNCKILNPVIMTGGSSKCMNDPLGILPDKLLDHDGIMEYFGENIPQYWFLHTKYQKFTDYDLWLMYAFNIEK